MIVRRWKLPIADGVCAALVDQASAWIDEVIAATGLYRRPQYHG